MDDKAQLHVLEVIIVAGLLFVSLYFVESMDVSYYSASDKENKLETLGRGILLGLEAQPDPSGKWDNLLTSYISNENLGHSRFESYVSSILPEGALFRINIVNMSKFFHNSSASRETCTLANLGTSIWFEEEACITRIVVVGNIVYELTLSIWYNSGG